MSKEKGCMCLDCACLGSCQIANCAITHCTAYLRAKITSVEAARLLGCHISTFLDLKKTKDGRKYIISRFKGMGYNVIIEGFGREAQIWRKEEAKPTTGDKVYRFVSMPIHSFGQV